MFLNYKEISLKLMYKFTTRSKKAEKQFYDILNSGKGISFKLEKLMQNPRKELDAHKLKGKLQGKWSCSLGYDIRMIYEIDDKNKEIVEVKRNFKPFTFWNSKEKGKYVVEIGFPGEYKVGDKIEV